VVVEMYDSYGDGWSEGVYTLTDSRGVVMATGTLEDGNHGWDELCDLPAGCYTMTVSEAMWFASESTWEITQYNRASCSTLLRLRPSRGEKQRSCMRTRGIFV
jgi:hypothetical protein